jgi:hypothetical protein
MLAFGPPAQGVDAVGVLALARPRRRDADGMDITSSFALTKGKQRGHNVHAIQHSAGDGSRDPTIESCSVE